MPCILHTFDRCLRTQVVMALAHRLLHCERRAALMNALDAMGAFVPSASCRNFGRICVSREKPLDHGSIVVARYNDKMKETVLYILNHCLNLHRSWCRLTLNQGRRNCDEDEPSERGGVTWVKLSFYCSIYFVIHSI
jgi:hypothetical protein